MICNNAQNNGSYNTYMEGRYAGAFPTYQALHPTEYYPNKSGQQADPCSHTRLIIYLYPNSFLLLLLLKKVRSARLRESDVHLISLKTPAPQYQPIDRKKRKGKKVEDYSRDRAA